MTKVKAKDTVKVHYTGKLGNGEVFDDSYQRGEPIEFTLGEGQIIPGFEKAVMDMSVEDKKSIEIPMAEAYGERREELVQVIPQAELPPAIKPEVGMQLVSKSPDGQEIPLRVIEVAEENITVDANPPLAGQDLHFDIELVAIV